MTWQAIFREEQGMTVQWLTDLRSRADGGDAVAMMIVEHIHALTTEVGQARGSLTNSKGAVERLRAELEIAHQRMRACENRTINAEARASAADLKLADANALIERCEAEIPAGARATLDLVGVWLDDRNPMRKSR